MKQAVEFVRLVNGEPRQPWSLIAGIPIPDRRPVSSARSKSSDHGHVLRSLLDATNRMPANDFRGTARIAGQHTKVGIARGLAGLPAGVIFKCSRGRCFCVAA